MSVSEECFSSSVVVCIVVRLVFMSCSVMVGTNVCCCSAPPSEVKPNR